MEGTEKQIAYATAMRKSVIDGLNDKQRQQNYLGCGRVSVDKINHIINCLNRFDGYAGDLIDACRTHLWVDPLGDNENFHKNNGSKKWFALFDQGVNYEK
jgi:hypothetical protein